MNNAQAAASQKKFKEVLELGVSLFDSTNENELVKLLARRQGVSVSSVTACAHRRRIREARNTYMDLYKLIA